MIEGQMEIKLRDSNAERIKTDLLVIPVREKKLDDALIRAAGPPSSRQSARAHAKK